MSKRNDYCKATREIRGERYYCQLVRYHDGFHSDDFGFWRNVTNLELTIEEERRLMREENTKVRDWKGDPNRDPSMRADLSTFFVAPPKFRK